LLAIDIAAKQKGKKQNADCRASGNAPRRMYIQAGGPLLKKSTMGKTDHTVQLVKGSELN